MDGIDPKVAAAVARRDPRRRRVHSSKKPVPQERITEDSFGTDTDIQNTSDLLTRRDPDEESVVREPYGPAVPASPFNVQKFMEKKLERTRADGQPRWRQEMNRR